jgi:hypothetical protein
VPRRQRRAWPRCGQPYLSLGVSAIRAAGHVAQPDPSGMTECEPTAGWRRRAGNDELM